MKGNQTTVNIPVADSVMSNIYSSFESICSLIGKSSFIKFYSYKPVFKYQN